MTDLTSILPHKPPMILLDEIKEVNLDNGTLTASFSVNSGKLFYEAGRGISSLTGIEFMAQTIGCYAFYRNNYSEPQPGLLLGSRLYNNKLRYFKENETYIVKVHEVFTDNEIVVFDCLIYDKDNNEIASATINAYQGGNTKELLKGE